VAKLSTDVSDYLKKTPFERQVETILWKWKSVEGKFKDDYRWIINEPKRRNAISTLKEADKVLKRLAPRLRIDSRVPAIIVRDPKAKISIQIKATDYLAGGGVRWVASWLSAIQPRGGRPPEAMIANCAEELAALYRKETGQSKWKRVGQIMAENFSKNLPTDDDRRDVRVWIYNLVKRNRRRRQKLKNEDFPIAS